LSFPEQIMTGRMFYLIVVKELESVKSNLH